MTMSANTAAAPAEFRAAGTDLSERRRSGVSKGPLIDIAASPDTTGMQWGADGALRIGALTTIAAIAADARIAENYPGIAAAALGLGARAAGIFAIRRSIASRRADRIVRRDRAIISTALRSISAPAWRRIPRPWRLRCSPMTPASSPAKGR